MVKYESFRHSIRDIVGSSDIKLDEPMSKHTTFRVGGPAKFLVTPRSIESIVSVINCCKENKIEYYILGNGSNVLVRDEGIDGVVIKIASNFSSINVLKNEIQASAGAYLGAIAKEAFKNSLGGFEFASGIPGTLGGAIIMNAGAYGKEMKDVVVDSTVLTDSGEIVTLTNEQHEFSYRDSVFLHNKCVVLGSKIKLYSDNKQDIQNYMNELAKKRRDKQPLDKPNAGSIFKRPEGYFAAQLIERAGLKGYRIGGAEVSTKHSEFIINIGNAKAKDILMLMDYVKDTVAQKFGVKLEPEIKIM